MTRVDNKSGSHPPAPRSHNAYPGGDHGPGEFHQVRAPAPGQLAQQLGSRVAPTCCVEIRVRPRAATAQDRDVGVLLMGLRLSAGARQPVPLRLVSARGQLARHLMMPVVSSPRAWFLSSKEWGNPHAELYAGAAGGAASTVVTRRASPCRAGTGRTRHGTTRWWEIRGPAVADVECCFRERWENPRNLAISGQAARREGCGAVTEAERAAQARVRQAPASRMP